MSLESFVTCHVFSTESVLLLPSLFESTFFVDNLFFFCLVLLNLMFVEPVQVLLIGHSLKMVINCFNFLLVFNLCSQISHSDSLFLLFLVVTIFNPIGCLFRPKVRFLVLHFYLTCNLAAFLVFGHLSHYVLLILLIGRQLKLSCGAL
jgi:hypothetical protein